MSRLCNVAFFILMLCLSMPGRVMGISPELKTLHKIFPVVDFTIYKEYNGLIRYESTGTYSHKVTVICFDLIQTKSSAPIAFISEDESFYTVKSVNVTKDGDILSLIHI